MLSSLLATDWTYAPQPPRKKKQTPKTPKKGGGPQPNRLSRRRFTTATNWRELSSPQRRATPPPPSSPALHSRPAQATIPQSWRARSTAMVPAAWSAARRWCTIFDGDAHDHGLRFESGRGQPLQSASCAPRGWVAEEAADTVLYRGVIRPPRNRCRRPTLRPATQEHPPIHAIVVRAGRPTAAGPLWKRAFHDALDSTPWETRGLRPDGGQPWREGARPSVPISPSIFRATRRNVAA